MRRVARNREVGQKLRSRKPDMKASGSSAVVNRGKQVSRFERRLPREETWRSDRRSSQNCETRDGRGISTVDREDFRCFHVENARAREQPTEDGKMAGVVVVVAD